MKFWVVLPLLFVAVCFDEAATVPKSSDERIFLDVTAGLSALIGEIIASVQASLHELTLETESLVQNALSEIDATIRNLETAIYVYIQEVRDQIEKLVNEELLPCLDGFLAKIDDVRVETHAAIENCREIGREKLYIIQQDVEAFRKVNQAAFEGALSFVHECSTLLNLGDKIKCAVDASRNVSSAVEVFRENLSHFITAVHENVGTIIADTKECINNEVVLAKQAIREIIDEATKCLEEKRGSEADYQPIIQDSQAAQNLEQKLSSKN